MSGTPSFQQSLEDLWSNRLAQRDGYIQVPTSLFVSRIDLNMPSLPPTDLYVEEPGGGFTLLRKANQPYSALALSVRPHVWIREQDLRPIRGFAETQAFSPATVTHAATPAEQRVTELRKNAMKVMDDLFGDPSPENIHRSTKVVSSFVYLLMKDPKAYVLLSKLSSHDPYTLQHSVGTAVACIILGKKLGIADEKDLNELGLAGLLHDIGKVRVRREVINKEGPLDEKEWEEMQQHSSAGYEILKDNPELSERTKRAVVEHHEDRNGNGYPGKLRPEQTHLFSKIVCICDVFNALTTDRTYSKARTPFEAFQFMRDKLQHKIDEQIFRELVLIYGGKLE
jgi:putative nucleotidyltransferase with HDIG domain